MNIKQLIEKVQKIEAIDDFSLISEQIKKLLKNEQTTFFKKLFQKKNAIKNITILGCLLNLIDDQAFKKKILFS